jgi:hypothetical protein
MPEIEATDEEQDYRHGYWGWWYFNRIEYRDEKGEFTSVEELTEVSGIGEATLEKNRDLLTAGE